MINFLKKFCYEATVKNHYDGRYFIKSKEKSPLSQTEAYNILFMKFSRDDDAAAEFNNRDLPNKK